MKLTNGLKGCISSLKVIGESLYCCAEEKLISIDRRTNTVTWEKLHSAMALCLDVFNQKIATGAFDNQLHLW